MIKTDWKCRYLALLLMLLTGSAAAQTQYTFLECDALEEGALRDELNRIAQQTLDNNRLQIAPVVARQWRQLELDRVLQREVGEAVAAVRGREAYLSRLWSSWSAEKANELAAEVAGKAFSSPGFQDAIGELAGAIAVDVAGAMETASVRSVSSALGCLQTFIGKRYSVSLLDVFDAEVKAQIGEVEFADKLDREFSLPGMHAKALAGVGIIISAQIARQLARRLAARVTGRIVTRVAGRAAATLVPVVGWIAGAGMIAWDLWEGADGALPQIEQALTGDEVRDEIQLEIAAVVAPELAAEMPKVARAVADNIYDTWQQFKNRYADVLSLADRNPSFAALLADTDTGEIYKLADLVAAMTELLGSEGLDVAIDRGRFRRLFRLPDGAATLLGDTESVDAVLAWGELAGDRLDDLVRLNVHRHRAPAQLDAGVLDRLLALNNPPLVEKLLRLERDDGDALATLAPGALKPLLARYDDEQLRRLAGYARELPAPARERLAERLAQRPSVIDLLRSSSVRRSLAGGADVDETLEFLTADQGFSRFIGDAAALAGGSVPLTLFWQRYGTMRNILVVLGVLAVWVVLGRLRSGRQRRPIVVNVTTTSAREGEPPRVSYDDR